VNVAAVSAQSGLPSVRAILGATSGGIASDAKSRGIPLGDLSKLDPKTFLVMLIGDKDHQASERASKRILAEATATPAQNKIFMRTLSDGHGFPSLSATLLAPAAVDEAYDAAKIQVSPAPPLPKGQKRIVQPTDARLTGEQTTLIIQLGTARADATDYWAFWKTFDVMTEHAHTKQDGFALRADARLTDMSTWSNGWPVKRLILEVNKDAPALSNQPKRTLQSPQ
jgi:hypothetical protein